MRSRDVLRHGESSFYWSHLDDNNSSHTYTNAAWSPSMHLTTWRTGLTSGCTGHVYRRGPCPPPGPISAQPGNAEIAAGWRAGQQWRGAVSLGRVIYRRGYSNGWFVDLFKIRTWGTVFPSRRRRRTGVPSSGMSTWRGRDAVHKR